MKSYCLWTPAAKLISECQPAFKTQKSFAWAFLIIIGFCCGGAHSGITSLARTLGLSSTTYTSMLEFFRSSAINLEELRRIWFTTISKALGSFMYQINGRTLIVVDEIKIGKEGNYMPGSRVTHQSSQNNSKRPYIMGHTVLVFGFIITALSQYARLIPFYGEILGGLREAPRVTNSLIDDAVAKLQTTSRWLDKAPIVVADALYAVKPFMQPLFDIGIHAISRVRSNAVAAYPALQPKKRGRGRPKKYGEWIKLLSVFDDLSSFSKKKSPIPGEKHEIQIKSLHLLTRWFKQTLLFVFVLHPTRGRIILVSTDPTLPALQVYLAYYHRFQIEVTFKQLKHNLQAFAYKFWTKALNKITWGAKDHYIHRKSHEEKRRILKTFQAYHLYIHLAFMAYGILSFIAIKYPKPVYLQFGGWLRTIRPNTIPSIEITSEALNNNRERFFASQDIPPKIAKFLEQKRRISSSDLEMLQKIVA